jgi:hypothetical protein
METRGLRKKSFNYELIILYFGIQKRNNKTWEHTCAVINRRTRHRQGERNYAICMKEQVSYIMLAKVKLNSHMMSKHATLATRFSLRLKEACDRHCAAQKSPECNRVFFFFFDVACTVLPTIYMMFSFLVDTCKPWLNQACFFI